MHFRARHCSNPTCDLRFPVKDGSELGTSCPLCGAETHFIDEAYVSEEARSTISPAPQNELKLEAFLDNIRSLRNVGSMFRTADGLGLHHLHLGGFTPTPLHPQLKKTALGAEGSVSWTSHRNSLKALENLRENGAHIWAIEGGTKAQALHDLCPSDCAPHSRDSKKAPIVLVFGHEVSGIDPRILAISERIWSIPMLGVKGSLNVSVAFGIAIYSIRSTYRQIHSKDI